MKRKDDPETIPPITFRCLRFLAFSTMMLILIGCGTRQHTAVTSESVPTKQKSVQPLEEVLPEIVAPESVVQASQKAEESLPSLQAEMQDQLEEVPEVSPVPQAEASKGPTTSESTETAEAALVPLLAEPVDVSKLPRTLSDIFFDYDQYRIRSDAINDLETNAKVLIARYPDKDVVIQGHCDERGTEEYNMVLGERRAWAVKDYLINLGVPHTQLQVISYGKTKPFCVEHNQKCWQQNRRSHFVMK